jgi:septum site-determining protein MinC
MLNNIKISQTTEEITLNVNVIAEMHEVIEELQAKLPKLRDFYQSSKIPIRVTGRLFTESEIETIKKIINDEIDVEVKFDDVSDLLGLHAIKKTFETKTEISETKYITNSIRSGQKEEYTGSIVIFGDVNAGAEVIAGGNIAILGTLRGLAHAGANGNTMAVISANAIDITQVRIANLVKEIEIKTDKCPICKIKDNNIVIQ